MSMERLYITALIIIKLTDSSTYIHYRNNYEANYHNDYCLRSCLALLMETDIINQ